MGFVIKFFLVGCHYLFHSFISEFGCVLTEALDEYNAMEEPEKESSSEASETAAKRPGIGSQQSQKKLAQQSPKQIVSMLVYMKSFLIEHIIPKFLPLVLLFTN